MNASHSTNLFQIHVIIFPPMAKLTPQYKPTTARNSSIRSDGGVTLETSAF